MPKMNIFRKMIVALGLLVVPILLVFFYTIQTTTGVVKDQINEANMNRLQYFANQLDTQMQRMTISGSALTQDPSILQFMGYAFMPDSYELARKREAIEQKLRLFSYSSNWPLQVSIYSNYYQSVVSNEPSVKFNPSVLLKSSELTWTSVKRSRESKETGYDFYSYTMLPEYSDGVTPVNLAVEMKFNEKPLVDLLDSYKQMSVDEPILLQPGGGVIVNRTADPELIRQLKAYVFSEPAILKADSGAFAVKLLGQSYEVFYVQIPRLGWYSVNAAPVEKIVEPIYKSRDLFIIFIGILTICGFISAFMLYKQVQSPLLKLIRSLKYIQNGNYSVRLHTGKKDEFYFVYQRFNEMAERIQLLIENVLHEQVRSREAKLKHLQSQINPHFIYNCMGFIINMTKLNKQEAVIKLAQNLSRYYRYTTHLENPEATLAEELDLIRNYLEIQRLRTEHVSYDIVVPDKLLQLQMPRLLMQPVVENAILHGIYGKVDSGYIRVEAFIEGPLMKLVVEDDGKGLAPEEIRELDRRIQMPLQEEDASCGLWNVNQRLQLRYGEEAGVRIEPSQWGGVKVTLYWCLKERMNGEEEQRCFNC